jgi:hypothetical protein
VAFGVRYADGSRFPPDAIFEFRALGSVLEIVRRWRRFWCGRLSPCVALGVDDRSVVDRDHLRRAVLPYAVGLHLDSTPRRSNSIIGDAALGADNHSVSRRLLSGSDARGLRWHIDQRRCSAG